MARRLFITLEGGEGGGKSTQAFELMRRLEGVGLNVLVTREPGGSPGAEAIRDLLVKGESDRWSPLTETLLMYAARRDHIERVIAPALERGTIVICDRYLDSTRAYQGAGGGTPKGLIDCLEIYALGGILPDLTLVFDLPPEVGLSRAAGRGDVEVRFEGKGLEFHYRLREEFLNIVRNEPERCRLINASAPREDVSEQVWVEVQRVLSTQ